MAVQPIQMFPPTLLTATLVTVYTVPANPTTNLLNRGLIRFSNTDTSAAHAVTGNAIQASGSPTVTNTFCPALSVPAGGTLDVGVPVLTAGGFIELKSDNSTAVAALSLDGILFS